MVEFSIPRSPDLVSAESLPKGGLTKPKGTVDDEVYLPAIDRSTKTNACDSPIGLKLDNNSLFSGPAHRSSVDVFNGRGDAFLFKSLHRSIRICGDRPIDSFPSAVAPLLTESRCQNFIFWCLGENKYKERLNRQSLDFAGEAIYRALDRPLLPTEYARHETSGYKNVADSALTWPIPAALFLGIQVLYCLLPQDTVYPEYHHHEVPPTCSPRLSVHCLCQRSRSP